MAGFFSSKTLWQYSHTLSILTAVLLFTAGFLCTLLWTNGIVQTPSSATNAMTNTLTSLSPAVSTFSITYQVAIFGTAWNAILYVILLILERDVLPISTTRLRYEIEKSACIVAVAGNAIYSVACVALMATLARLAADATPVRQVTGQAGIDVAADWKSRRAGQGATAAFAGLAAAMAVWACVMDTLHAQNSRYRRIVKEVPATGRPDDAEKQA